MIVDGRALAEKVKIDLGEAVKVLPLRPHLAIVLVGNNPMSAKYTGLKKKLGEDLGITVAIKNFAATVTTDELVDGVKTLVNDLSVDGLIIQLPLPEQVNREQVFAAIDPAKDVDALSGQSVVLSPVVMAIKYILDQNSIFDFSSFKTVVVGHGYLVGQPVAKWFTDKVASLKVLTTNSSDEESKKFLAEADLIVAGAGVPNLIKPQDIKEGVILIDASTSDVDGKTVGDIDPACANKARLYTPVPGGVGPLTVVMLFKNLLELMKK